MKFKLISLILVSGFLNHIVPAFAEDFTIEQKNKRFSTEKIKLKVGDTIYFKNEDPFSHNIFSLSELATFDLGSYPQGQSRPYTFSKPGKIQVECALHPNMQLEVEVTP